MRKFKRVNNMRFGICALVMMMLIISQAGISKIIHKNKDAKLNESKLVNSQPIPEIFSKYRRIVLPIKTSEQKIEKTKKSKRFVITAYDLSIKCTGKSRGDSGYGITKDGTDLRGLTWRARVISVDPRLMPLGSKVELEFVDENYKKYNGIYYCRDTGSRIIGNKIDFFMGDFHSEKASKETIGFGNTEAYVTILD